MSTQMTEPRMDLEQHLHMYRQMAKIRAFEEQVNELYKGAKMPGLAHLYVGRGSGRGRGLRGAQARRLHHEHAPRPRPLPGQGRVGEPDVRRAARQGGGLLPRQGRLHAHRGSRDGQSRRQRHRGRVGRPRHRRRALGQDAQERPGRGVLLRRRRARAGAALRGDEHGLALEAARHLRVREQPLRRVHPGHRDDRRRDPRPARARWACTPRAWTGRTCRRCTPP